MNVNLGQDLAMLVHRKLETGRYDSATDVISEALRLMDERDRLQDLHQDEIRRKIATGMASLRAGRSSNGEELFDRFEAELDDDGGRDPA